MKVQMTMIVNLTLPDGSASMDGTGGRGWVLPDGNFVKVFPVVELNDERDLTWVETEAMGIDADGSVLEVEMVA
jgi:hypothetical protein